MDTLKEEHRTLTHALTLYPPVSTPSSTPSSSVVNINDVGQLSGELNIPQLSSEPDAISARATVRKTRVARSLTQSVSVRWLVPPYRLAPAVQ